MGNKRVLKGKYREIITEYLRTVEMERTPIFRYDHPWDEMIASIHRVYSGFMSRMDVVRSVLNVFNEFEREFERSDGTYTVEPEVGRQLVEDRLVDYFAQFPKDYRLVLHFPDLGVDLPDCDIDIADGVNLALTGREGVLYIAVQGYSEPGVETMAQQEAFSRANRVMFCMMVTCGGYYDDQHSFAGIFWDHTEEGASFSLKVPPLLEGRIAGLRLRCYRPALPEYQSFLLYDPFVDLLRTIFADVGKALSVLEEKGQENLAAAVDWYEDAHVAQNESVRFIQYCIGLEALLGDPTEIIGNARLADRIAFLLSGKPSGRAGFITQFGEIMDVRNKLVHGKRARLSEDNRRVLALAEKFLRLAIIREVELISGLQWKIVWTGTISGRSCTDDRWHRSGSAGAATAPFW